LGRRTSKVRLENGKILAKSQVEFIWDGSHLVQEIHKSDGKNGTENDRTFSYIYSHPNSYEPLAQLEFAKDNEKPTACYYYHNDQIGIPRELTDEQGKLCWYANYSGWGKVKEEYDLTEEKSIHQPFRLQNQYADEETGLHYNFFRYYEPNIGRFTQLDPIGLLGGNNLYIFAINIYKFTDVFGLSPYLFEQYDWNGLAMKATADNLAKEIYDKAYYMSEGSIGIETNADISLIKKVNGSVGALLTKNKNSNSINMCVYASKCDGVEIGGGGDLSIQGVISDTGTTSGVSHSMCLNGSAALGGGISASACSDGNSKSISLGISGGAKKGMGIQQCIQFTKCTDF
ncbi:RHS repeat-associated core domain-containing protein, partial [Gallibacterium anatis]